MAQIYSLVPLPIGPFEGIEPVTRMVFGLLYGRLRLSGYNLIGGDQRWFDHELGATFCCYSIDELAQDVGVSEKTIRRCLARLNDLGFVFWRKSGFKGSNRYTIHDSIMDYMRTNHSGQNDPTIRSA